MGVINIAHGAFLILAAFVTYSIWTATGLDPLVSVLFTTPMMFCFGWLLYRGTVEHVRGAHVSSSVLLTFALALVIEGAMGLIWGNTSHSVRPSYVNESFTIGEIFLPKAQVYGGALAIVVLTGLYLILTRTWLGRAIRASAVNPSGAALVGVNVVRRRRAHVRASASRPRAPAARSSASSTRSCPARTTSGSRACSGSSCSAGWAACPGRWSARCCSASRRP